MRSIFGCNGSANGGRATVQRSERSPKLPAIMKHFPSKHVDPVEVIVGDSRTADDGAALRLQEERTPMWINVFALLIWLIAGAVPFVPFAFDTSPWDAVRLRVLGNQGNWWHLLAGAPFFLAFSAIWLRLRSLFAAQLSTAVGRSSLKPSHSSAYSFARFFESMLDQVEDHDATAGLENTPAFVRRRGRGAARGAAIARRRRGRLDRRRRWVLLPCRRDGIRRFSRRDAATCSRPTSIIFAEVSTAMTFVAAGRAGARRLLRRRRDRR
jgi:hypothetical protein